MSENIQRPTINIEPPMEELAGISREIVGPVLEMECPLFQK